MRHTGAMAAPTLHLTGDETADRVLSEDPFALLLGMLLDQQYPMEHAFRGPAKILDRFGTLDPAKVAAADPEADVGQLDRRRRALLLEAEVACELLALDRDRQAGQRGADVRAGGQLRALGGPRRPRPRTGGRGPRSRGGGARSRTRGR